MTAREFPGLVARKRQGSKAGYISGWLGSTLGGQRAQIRGLRAGARWLLPPRPRPQLLSPARVATLNHARRGQVRLARVAGPRSSRRAAGGTGPARREEVARRRWNGTPRGHLGHVVPGVSKILRIRATAQEDRCHNSGELRFYREAQTDIPDPLFIPDKSAWPRLPSRLPSRLQPMVIVQTLRLESTVRPRGRPCKTAP